MTEILVILVCAALFAGFTLFWRQDAGAGCGDCSVGDDHGGCGACRRRPEAGDNGVSRGVEA
ncbi:MAG: hypothetical protein HY700_10065 [Gemmatimonadetes bacterium]|nr:hypothetical protein [Gemmatimonadota bacterium]